MHEHGGYCCFLCVLEMTDYSRPQVIVNNSNVFFMIYAA